MFWVGGMLKCQVCLGVCLIYLVFFGVCVGGGGGELS